MMLFLHPLIQVLMSQIYPFPHPSSSINPIPSISPQPNEIIPSMSPQAAEIIPPISHERDEIPLTISLDNGRHHIEEEVLKEIIVEDTPTPKRQKNTRGSRVLKCKSPFVDYCLSKYSRLTHSETTIANYIFDETNDPMSD